MFSTWETRLWEYWLHKQDLCQHTHCRYCDECPGHARGGIAPLCCDRAGDYSGYPYESGPAEFHCPKNCSCHD